MLAGTRWRDAFLRGDATALSSAPTPPPANSVVTTTTSRHSSRPHETPGLPAPALEGLNHSSGSYNQIANYVIAQSEINIGTGAKPPTTYFAELREQVSGGAKKYGGITDRDELLHNLRMNCIPETMLDGEVKDYEQFLEDRRKLMALKIKRWFEVL